MATLLMASAVQARGSRSGSCASRSCTCCTQLHAPAMRMVAGTRTVKRRQAVQPIQASIVPAGAAAPLVLQDRSAKDDVEMQYLNVRAKHVTDQFETALGVDDFMQRLEIALWGYGFQNDNSIAMVNLCRDEVTHVLKHKIDQIFGSSFNTNGLGGVLTCGVTGVGAGLSHSPVSENTGKERYVFFSFPHIGIDSQGVVGNISRPGRAAMSCACGALIKSLGDIKKDGLACSCQTPGVHEPMDIELSILKQRLARRLFEVEGYTEETAQNLDLTELTKVAERVISSDLEFLISKAVNVEKADYAVVTGVQIHNWSSQFDDEQPNLEFVAPVNVYVVVDGKRIDVDLSNMPALTPRQVRLLASAPDAHNPSPADSEEAVCNSSGMSTLREIDPPYMYNSRQARRKIQSRLESFSERVEAEVVAPVVAKVEAVVEKAPEPVVEKAPEPAPEAPKPRINFLGIKL